MSAPALTAVWCRDCCGLVLATSAPFRPAYVERWVAAVFSVRTAVQAYPLAEGLARLTGETWCTCTQREDLP